MATYVVSDLHGYKEVFERGLEITGFSDNDELYVIGDAIDRGPDGGDILCRIKDSKNMDLIIGNHELMMLNSVDLNGEPVCNGEDSELWLEWNGGDSTFEKYKDLTTKERQELLFWMMHRYLIKILNVGGRTFCLTHSCYLPECENRLYNEFDYDTVSDVVWNSMLRDDETHCGNVYAGHDYMFITGHVPTQVVRRDNSPGEDFNRLKSYGFDNFLDIDGGCSFGINPMINNGAIFVRLDDMKEFPVPMKNI